MGVEAPLECMRRAGDEPAGLASVVRPAPYNKALLNRRLVEFGRASQNVNAPTLVVDNSPEQVSYLDFAR